MKHRIYTIFLFIVSFNGVGLGQNTKTIDSLYQVISEVKLECSEPCSMDTVLLSSYVYVGDLLFMNDPDSALDVFKLAEQTALDLISSDLSKQILNTTKIYLADALYYIGFIHKNQGDALKAIHYYKKSLKIDIEFGNKLGMAAAFHNIGNVYDSQGDLSNAITYYEKSLKIKEELKDHLGVGYSLNSFGTLYLKQGDENKALQFFLKSLSIFKKFDQKHEIAVTINNIGSIYDALGQTKKALEWYEKSLEISKESEDKRGIALTLNNIGAMYAGQENSALAIQYYNKSLKISEEIGDAESVALTLFNIGIIKLDDNQSIKYEANKVYTIGKELGLPLVIEKGAALMKRFNQKKGDFKRAYKYYQEEIEMKDSILNDENYKVVQKQQARYEYLKQAAIDSVSHFNEVLIKDQDLLEEKEKNKIKTITYASVFLCFSIIFVLVFYFQRIKIKKNEELRNKEAQISKITIKNQELENNALQVQLEYKSKELINFALHIVEKNDFLEGLRKVIIESDAKTDKQQLKKLIDENLSIEKDRQEFSANVESLHESFFLSLGEKFPKLTKNDKRLCALLRLNLSSKEIATVQKISPSSVDVSRYRLRKKLNISIDQNLSDFLNVAF